ncbi:MerR family transcriptional regulator [Amaricoccus sp.]|uniref:MerR family transcriptional regulator n=1 Tax=Amaricoccus sp. TaxID=1872485 RepID=UPI001B46F1AE|nr:MerR family transcriptional regulator [Amaricoccus sp.]MBP7240636.1 hypothetical protein [Amaricoccus sp.]
MAETRYYSETEVVAQVDGVTVARLRSWVSAHCLSPEEREGRLAFREADVARARLLAELSDDFEMDEDAAGMVLSLIDQIHGLRHRLRGLATALAEEPEDVRARIRARLTRP